MSHALEMPWVFLWSWSFHGLLQHPGRFSVLLVMSHFHFNVWFPVSQSYGLAVHLCSPLPVIVPFNMKYTGGVPTSYYWVCLSTFQLQIKPRPCTCLASTPLLNCIPRPWLLRWDSLYSSGGPRICLVCQVDFKLMTLLPLPLKCYN